MLNGIIRESNIKQATKTLRRDGYLIANIYGKGLENINAAFKVNDFIRTVKNKETVAFMVSVDGKELNVVVKEYQSHPLKGNLLHVDLMIAQAGVKTFYHVPVKTTGIPKGLKNKGILMVSKERIRVRCTIENLPNILEIDIANLDTGDSVLIRDVSLGDKVEIMDSGRVAILGMIKAK